MTAQKRVIDLAESQVGYLYKKSNAQLDDFTANAGGKWNKYARDLDALGDFYNGRKNGYDGCDVFVDWLFVQTFGREVGQRMLFQPDRSLGAGTRYSMNYYKQKGRFFSTPQLGDQIFFGDTKSVWHTGIVVKVASGFVHTVEGNAGNPPAVRSCRYTAGGRTILGYGRPDWSLVPEDKPSEDFGKIVGEEVDDMTYEQWKEYMERYNKERAAQPASEWAAEELAAAKAAGITDGTRPRSFVTREEAAIMAVRSKG